MNREPTPREADLLRWIQAQTDPRPFQRGAAKALEVSACRIEALVDGLRFKGYIGRPWYTLTAKGRGWR